MSVLILSKKNPASHPYQEWLAGAGPLFLLAAAGSRPKDPSGWAWSEEFAEYNRNGAVEIRAVRLGQEHKVRRVVSLSEADVVRAARIRQWLGVPGQSVESALAFRDKHRMKTLVSEAGLAVPRFRAVDCVGGLVDFAAEVGGPIVVKRRSGSGSVGVRVLADRRAVEQWAAGLCMGPDEPWGLLAEEYVDARLFHVNGIMSGGQVLHAWSSAYVQPPMKALEQGRPQTVVMLSAGSETARVLEEFTASVIAALPCVEEPTSFHAELFLAADRTVSLCEIAARTGGCGINDVSQLAYGVDLNLCSARGQAGLPIGLPPRHAPPPRGLFGCVLLPPRAGRLMHLPATCPLSGVVSYRPRLAPGATSVGTPSVSSAAAVVLIAGATPNEQVERMAAVERWFYGLARWHLPAPVRDDDARREASSR
ncbi:ATP-grasp domain-containing protein [Streptomyces gilvosporeus]|uniref:ATP-grasp domain-containing protein n=1 Tax=Streptomyces gilvosporeus TaxID=553510 RepID=A0A1V0TK60_9ACTN|nr:ATP-grasp domain-containing protein [Streptomyces gilvosporeus]ARF53260.1 hypothetical protein B1H19_02955 [Streptomyces gilvosporeus]